MFSTLRPRGGGKLIGFLVLAVMGTPSLARAELLPNWMVNPTREVGSGLVVEFTPELEKSPVLLTEVGGQKVEVSCEKLTTKDGLLGVEGKSSATLEFGSCQTKIGGTLSAVCKPAEPIVAKVKGAIALHEGVAYERLEPAEGTSFTHIHFSELCTLEVNEGGGVPVTGSAYLKDANGQLETEAISHLAEEAQVGLGGLSFGVHPATMDGSANVSLLGTHKGLTWSGLGE
jgi:hypothetical protein